MPNAPLNTVHVLGSVREREQGVSGVQVEARGRAWNLHGEAGRAVTDSSGNFTMDLAEGEYEVVVDPPSSTGLDFDYFNILITKKSPRIDYVYGGVRIQGTVFSPTGAIADSGYVSFATGSEGAYRAFHSGHYSLLLPRAASYETWVGAWAPGYFSRSLGKTVIASDTTIDLHLNGYSMSGMALGPDGLGLGGVFILGEGPTFYSRTVSESGGNYQLWVAEPGARFRMFPPSNMPNVMPRSTSFIYISGSLTRDLSLVGTRWNGIVRSSADSAAIASVRVEADFIGNAYQAAAVDSTKMDGHFELVLEPGREYDLLIVRENASRRIYGLIAGADSTFDIYLDVPTP